MDLEKKLASSDITITGTVAGVSDTRNGGSVIRIFDENPGDPYPKKRYVSCWFDAPMQVEKGQTVAVTGFLWGSIGTYDKKNDDGTIESKQGINWNLNNCTIGLGEPPRTYGSDNEDLPF